jgi:ABC-type transporter Mla MlaB component
LKRAAIESGAAASMPIGDSEQPPSLTFRGDGERAALSGALVIRTLASARAALGQRSGSRKLEAIDLSGLASLDTPGALFLCALRDSGVQLTGTRSEHAALLELVCALDLAPLPRTKEVSRARQFVTDIGRGADEFWRDSLDVIAFVGRAAGATMRAV